MIRSLLALLVALGLAGCGTLPNTVQNGDTQDEVEALVQFASDDLRAALADANAHGDVIAATCWSKLLEKVDDLPRLTEGRVIGAASAYQKARNIRRRVDAGWSDDVRLACAALADDGRSVLARLLRRIGGTAIPGL